LRTWCANVYKTACGARERMSHLEGLATINPRGSKLDVHFTGERDGCAVVVRDRNDRHPLVSLFYGKNQICQINKDQVPAAQAVAVMVAVAQKFCSGDIEKVEVKKIRDEMLKAKGQEARKEVKAKEKAMKRPAAADQGPAECPNEKVAKVKDTTAKTKEPAATPVVGPEAGSVEFHVPLPPSRFLSEMV
jgi:hypothetical protein